MSSLREISAQSPALVLDAASAQIQVGILAADGTARWYTSTEEAGVALFEGMQQLDVDPPKIQAFVFCEGPGSVLGIRTVAMALRTWQVFAARPIFAYCSLALVAHALRPKDVGVIADARRDSWHLYRIGHGLKRVAAAQLSGDLVMPDHFRHWSALPPHVQSAPYSLAELLPAVWDEDLLHRVEHPDAFLHEEPSYVTWTPQIHRAPDAP